MSRIFITIGSAHSKAANVNPVDGVWCVFHAMVPPTKKFKRELGWR